MFISLYRKGPIKVHTRQHEQLDGKDWTANNHEVWVLNADIRTILDVDLKWIRAEGSPYLPFIEKLFTNLSNGTIPLGVVTKGERQIVGIASMVITKWWHVIDYIVDSPAGGGEVKRHTYLTMGGDFSKNPIASQLLAITRDRKVLVVKQHRHPTRSWTIELPGGIIDPGEGEREAAVREALEEGGMVLTDDSTIHRLGLYRPDTGASGFYVALMMATNIEVSDKFLQVAQGKGLQAELVPLSRFEGLVACGLIDDGHSLSAYARAKALGLL